MAIAVRNGENYLMETLRVIPPSTPIIVSDNHSTDGTAMICKSFKNVIYYKPLKRLTMLENWDFVSHKVRTEYFRLVGHDDLVNPESILMHERFLDANVNHSFVRSKRILLMESKFLGNFSLSTPQPGQEIRSSADIVKAVALSGTNIIGEPFTATIRTDLFQSKICNWGGDQFGMCELNTWTELARLGDVGYSETLAGTFRVHSKSYSASLGSPLRQARLIRNWALTQKESNELTSTDLLKMHLNGRLRAFMRSIVHLA